MTKWQWLLNIQLESKDWIFMLDTMYLQCLLWIFYPNSWMIITPGYLSTTSLFYFVFYLLHFSCVAQIKTALNLISIHLIQWNVANKNDLLCINNLKVSGLFSMVIDFLLPLFEKSYYGCIMTPNTECNSFECCITFLWNKHKDCLVWIT